MSLSLIQGYSSAEEDEQEAIVDEFQHQNSSDDEDGNEPSAVVHPSLGDRSLFDIPHPSTASGLPSAFDAFSEISGPPQFLNNSVEEYGVAKDTDQQQVRHGSRRKRKERKDMPTGAVVEAKAQLVGIHERVRNDIDGGQPPTSVASSHTEGGKKIATATNPNAEDAADLLRMCLQCGIPKTYSSVQGMICPVCGDRPPSDTSNESKKKGSAIKDKEKSKRMKGQSSHATWKSETEMQLRQQFD
ncbi:Plant/MHJ24-14 protein [Quillaja saponaria]|uniref:Plant/MHJ24-14 protein n=1 Tax=Quillaja saponaria TaxID=32244 RepID=A0AAD7P9I4_QUISA|nr:Plant/MHJ24-14 protein [Quillaja saponaria]